MSQAGAMPPAGAAPPQGQISRAPIRYNLPSAPEKISTSEAALDEKLAESGLVDGNGDEQPRSSRPGQTGFAERLMAKYGWSKGQGLGAEGTGIINPLYAKADKRKKRSDAEGGGYVTPATTGKILGGNKSKIAQAEEEGKFGAMSEVIRLEGMLTGLDLDDELAQGEGGIMQEIGEECGDKYGSVERVYIHRPESKEDEALVFVYFVSQLSALRAVNALEGRIFNGNPIMARFWPREKFDGGQYF
jgi:splicing factor 45